MTINNESLYAQSSLDSVICKYLVENGEIDRTVDSTSRMHEGKLVRKTNYFFDRKPEIYLSDSVTILPVIFGCYKSHTNKYLLIKVDNQSTTTVFFYGKGKLLQEVDKLRAELIDQLKPSFKDENIAALMNYLSLCYL